MKQRSKPTSPLWVTALLLAGAITTAYAQATDEAVDEDDFSLPTTPGISSSSSLSPSTVSASSTNGPSFSSVSPASLNCPEDSVSFELITGYVYSAPADMLDSQPGTLMLTDCVQTCRQNRSCQAINYETGLCVLFGSHADSTPGKSTKTQFREKENANR